MSVRQSLGKVAVVPKGSWDGTKTYEFLDIVKSGGGSYIARQDVPIGIAITNTEYWVSLVDKGDPGDSAIVPAYIDTDVIRYLNDHGTHAADDIYTSLLMREDVDSGVLPFIMRPTGSDSTTEEYFELDHQIHSAVSPVIHFRSREHLLAVDSTGHFTLTDRPQGGSGGGAVDSVNGKTGTVVLTASDVGALPSDTPIPAAVTEQSVSGWGFTKNTGTYSKPSTGIPKSDLASNVQASLGKADTALQTAPVTSVNAKNGAVTLTASDVGALPSSTSIPTKTSDLTNDSNFQTAAQVQTAVSGKADKVLRVAMTSTDTTATLDPNKLYVFPEMASLAVTLATPTDNTIVNEYHFIFTSGATATTLSIPSTVNQPDGFTVDANMVYEVSILENNMTAQGWAVTA